MSKEELAKFTSVANLSNLSPHTVFTIVTSEKRNTKNGFACAVGVMFDDSKDVEEMLLPERFVETLATTTPCCAIYMGQQVANSKNTYHVLHVLPPVMIGGLKSTKMTLQRFRAMSNDQQVEYFTPRSLKQFPDNTVFTLSQFTKTATSHGDRVILTANYTTVMADILVEGLVYLPDRLEKTVAQNVPGCMLYRGQKSSGGGARAEQQQYYDVLFISKDVVARFESNKRRDGKTDIPATKRLKLSFAK